MKTLKELALTELEVKFIETLVGALYAEKWFTDVDVNDMAEDMGIPVASAKGVLGSLVKKGIVFTDRNDSGYDLISLHGEYHYLHPRWNDEE